MEPNIRSKAMWFWGEGWSRFGVFGVVGISLVWTAHSLFPGARWSIAILAVLLMASFGYSEWPYKRGQEDRLGDDLYYLGLTYTFASVAHALWAFTGVVDVNRLVSDFSVALLTTLVGIVGRVLLYEKNSSQKQAVDADEGVTRLRAEIEGAIEQMHEFRRGLAVNVQHATETAVQSAGAALISFSTNANEMSAAAKLMNASLKKNATAFDKSSRHIGDASDALGARVGELTERTKALATVSEALNQQGGSLTASLEQQTQALWATVETHKETARRIGAELNGPLVSFARSIDEAQKQVTASKQALDTSQLKTNIDDASNAAEQLGRNLRSAVNTLSSGSFEANLSALNVFARAITELTEKIDACTVRLAHLTDRADNTQAALNQPALGSTDNPDSEDPIGNAPRINSNGYQTDATDRMTETTIEPRTDLEPDSLANENDWSEFQDGAPENKTHGWWRWRRN